MTVKTPAPEVVDKNTEVNIELLENYGEDNVYLSR